MPCILSLDQGTTGSRALLIDGDGTVIGKEYREFTQHFPNPGWVEHDAEELFQSTVSAARALLHRTGARPGAIGITNQRETIVLWDRRSLRAVAPAIVWQDRRTTQRCAQLSADGILPLIRHRTGLLLDPYFSATKLEWLLQDPDLRKRAEQGELAAGTVESWLVARLTDGRAHVTDHTNASRTLLYNLHSRAWDPELCSLFNIPGEILAEIVPSSGIVTETSPEHLDRAIPIAGLAGDQQAALFGQGCVTPGAAKNTYGTGAFLLLYAGETTPTLPPPEGLLATMACSPSGAPAVALEGSVFIAGAAIQWLRDGLGILADAADSEALARSVPDTAGVHFVPAFVGLGSPHWHPEARGTITGITRGTNRAHLARAALEAIAFSSAELLLGMTSSTGLSVPLLRVDGGATTNDWLMEFQADLLGIPIERPDVFETTALGAALLAGLAVGVWPSVDRFTGLRSYRRFDPTSGASERAARWQGWRRAVAAALSWADGDSELPVR